MSISRAKGLKNLSIVLSKTVWPPSDECEWKWKELLSLGTGLLFRHSLKELRTTTRTVVPAEAWTRHLPNTNQSNFPRFREFIIRRNVTGLSPHVLRVSWATRHSAASASSLPSVQNEHCTLRAVIPIYCSLSDGTNYKATCGSVTCRLSCEK